MYLWRFAPILDEEIEDFLWNLFLEHKLVKKGKLRWNKIQKAIKRSQYYKQEDAQAQEQTIKDYKQIFDIIGAKNEQKLNGKITENEFKTACLKTHKICDWLYETYLEHS